MLGWHDGQVDLLFADVQMPGSRDGFALAREAAARWPHIRILAASARATPGPGDLPEDAHFVGKPFSAEAVYARPREALPDHRKPEPPREG